MNVNEVWDVFAKPRGGKEERVAAGLSSAEADAFIEENRNSDEYSGLELYSLPRVITPRDSAGAE